ncbi:MAG: NUDIX domain-containing protein [Spirochaetales bacterium]|nr:NUDIX domain-containing protein [Spirochaetales bacterium]
MIELKLHHQNSLNLQGKSFIREAVRAYIRKGDKALFIHSPKNGDYKLPGGGIETGEDREEALRREILEESGYSLSAVGSEIALITEFFQAKEPELDYFQMNSHYFACEIEKGEPSAQNLDDYESKLEMTPVWMEPRKALELNRAVIRDNPSPPRWTKREILFLENLSQ